MILLPKSSTEFPDQIVLTRQQLVLKSPYTGSCWVKQTKLCLHPLHYVLDRLIDPKCCASMLETDNGMDVFNYQKYIVGEFYRRVVNPNFPYEKIKKGITHRKNFVELINKEVDLWVDLLSLLKEVHRKNKIPYDPAYALYALIKESALVNFYIIYSDAVDGIAQYREFLQAQNKILQSLDNNPFDVLKHPVLRKRARSKKLKDQEKEISNIYNQDQVRETKKYVDMFKELAEKNEAFRKKYSKFVRSRMSLFSSLAKEPNKDLRFRLFRDDKENKQGRRKNTEFTRKSAKADSVIF